MASYKIEWKHSARKELKKLPKRIVLNILKLVEELAVCPYPPKAKKLVGTEHTFRIRSGNYRVIYNVSEKVLLIEVVRIGHRREVYGKLK